MRRIILPLVVLALLSVASPAFARSTKPAGVTTGQWVDYCGHTQDLLIAINGIVDETTANPYVATLTTYGDLILTTAVNFHRDANKIDGKLGTRIEALSRAAKKAGKTYLDTGKLTLRSLEIAADPLPACA